MIYEIYAAVNIKMGNLKEGSSTGDFERSLKGSLGKGASLTEEAHCGEPQGRALSVGTLGYERKALVTGISLHGGSVGQPGVSSSTGNL
jgi:hypothetical protein